MIVVVLKMKETWEVSKTKVTLSEVLGKLGSINSFFGH